MKKPDNLFWSAGTICIIFLVAATGKAQIVPDGTLPNNSIVIPNGTTSIIEGGTQAGGNLFHSFREFSILTGGTGFFNNALDIQNIFTRVTGGSISHIDGIIKANGRANLFLLNPNGIIFGPNAQLNIGGAFIGSTASSIRFADGSEFSATNPTAPPLLTINVPIGLQFGSNPGAIINQSQVQSSQPLSPLNSQIPIPNNVGLEVQPGQTLALVGGDIQLNGGNLTASNGQILLGSVASYGFVSFTTTPLGLDLNYDNIQNFGNIVLSGGSRINTSGNGGGRVEIRGGSVTLSGGQIYALTLGNIDGRGIEIRAQQLRIQNGSQISTIALADGKAGNINIRATDLVEMLGIGFDSYQLFIARYLTSGTIDLFDRNIVLATGTYGIENAGNIEIETGNLLLRDGAIAGSATFGAGNSGNLTINANVIEMVGAGINTGTIRGSTGRGGNIDISTQKLTVRDGAGLVSLSNSIEAAGNITIQAAESVEVLRSPAGSVVQTLISATTLDPNGIGDGGHITIDTKRLSVVDGAGISTTTGGAIGDIILSTTGGRGGDLTIRATESVEVAGISQALANGSQSQSFLATQTFSSSRAGDIHISSPVVTVRNGGLISAASLGAADAGNITIDANRVEVIGSGGNGRLISSIDATVGIVSIFANPNAMGTAGSVNLNVGQLIVRDGATVSVQALGTGRAGSINVVGNAFAERGVSRIAERGVSRIALDNAGSIDAATASGSQGNINLRANNILLRRGSRILTNATETATGGNIVINTGTLTALENSDITANSQTATGGNVTINAAGIFGIEFRDRTTPLSDITATGGNPGLSGTVEIRTTNNQVENAIAQSENNFVSTDTVLATSCIARSRAGNSFTVTGNGGLPPTPYDPLMARYAVAEVQGIGGRGAEEQGGRREIENAVGNSGKQQDPIVEARGFVITTDGETRLVSGDVMRSLANAEDFICR
ncbi:MAG TPA: filamentous hemagglutinin [Cyanobacteria bacterium UBA11372]|nr:filamentous hemagglutinin [Cyanobacteria bacterium UBA11372]